MKHLEPFKPEEPPSSTPDLLRIELAIVAMVFALGFVPYCLRDGGIISSEMLLISLMMLVTIGGCTFILLDSGQHEGTPTANDGFPPFDVYLVWPPAKALWDKDLPPKASAHNDAAPGSKPS